MFMSDCIFCKIIKGEIPGHILYEDEKVLVMLDAFPIAKGHILIIPKEHYVNIFDIPADLLGHIGKISKAVAINLKDKLGADGINIVNANEKAAQQSVFHYHMHLVPRWEKDGLDLWFHGKEETKIDPKEVYEILRED
jgi:histidine triad (HIT) family protein